MNDRIFRQGSLGRREFMKASTALGLSAFALGQGRSFAAGSDKLKAGLVGCGGRGTGAAMNCLDADAGVELVAIGDLFEGQVKWAMQGLGKNRKSGSWSSTGPWQNADRVKVTPETSFAGWDAAEKVINSDIDLVMLACPPHFRPAHLRAAVEAGKHVFMEKPVAVDPVGVRSVIESAKIAEEKGLSIIAGTQRRHQENYLELMQRIHDGQIGELVGGQCYWNWDSSFKNWPHRWRDNKSQMENMIRRWVFYVWLSGDCICEQHMHNIDIINWAYGGPPVQALGTGGRQYRTWEHSGNVYDHFAIEFEYSNGAKVMSMCRQQDKTAPRISECVVGTKGRTYADSNGIAKIIGDNGWEYGKEAFNPYEQEHKDLIASIREGKPLNEAKRAAESTLTAIMGRISAYTGRAVKYDWVLNRSELKLGPDKYEFGDVEIEPVAIPGQTKLV